MLKTCPFLSLELKKEWSQISKFCTRKWMQTIIQKREQKYLTIIQQLKLKIASLAIHTLHLPIVWLQTLKKHTKKNEDQLLTTKRGKIRRDQDDYNFDRVFNWKKVRFAPHPTPLYPGIRPIPLIECSPQPNRFHPHAGASSKSNHSTSAKAPMSCTYHVPHPLFQNRSITPYSGCFLTPKPKGIE